MCRMVLKRVSKYYDFFGLRATVVSKLWADLDVTTRLVLYVWREQIACDRFVGKL